MNLEQDHDSNNMMSFYPKNNAVFSSVLSTTLIKKTRGSLSTIRFTSDDILKIIRNLDRNKAHGHDMISIRMVKLCDASLCKPLELIFKSCLESGKFPLEWKKANVVPAYKKGDKQKKYLNEYCQKNI